MPGHTVQDGGSVNNNSRGGNESISLCQFERRLDVVFDDEDVGPRSSKLADSLSRLRTAYAVLAIKHLDNVQHDYQDKFAENILL